MENFELLKKAIAERKPIEFVYDNSAAKGKRIGNPHIIFIHNDNTNNFKVHVYQTWGDSSKPEDIPCWRPFIINHIRNLRILEDNKCFNIAPGYNPNNAKLYSKIITKI